MEQSGSNERSVRWNNRRLEQKIGHFNNNDHNN